MDPNSSPISCKNVLKDCLTEIEDRPVEDFPSFFNQFSDSIDKFFNLANSLKYNKTDKNPQILIFGEMG